MTIHKIVSKEGIYHLEDEMLIVRYPEGDIDTIGPKSSKKNLHRALYDHYQCSNEMKDGDSIALPNGKIIAHCIGCHVIMED